MTPLHRFLSSLIVVGITALVSAGCGPSSVVIDPRYDTLHTPDLKRDGLRIIHVTDGRPHQSARIGTARVGLTNRQVPFLLKGSLPDVVKTMLDTMIAGRSDDERFVPVSVSIDKFELGESSGHSLHEGNFECKLRFTYPLVGDSTACRDCVVRQTVRSESDITYQIEPLIYTGMQECARKFVVEAIDQRSRPRMVSSDSVEVVRAIDSTNLAKMNKTEMPPSEPAIVPSEKGDRDREIELHFCQGVNIRTGITLTLTSIALNGDHPTPWGFGIGMTYYDIAHQTGGITGNFFSVGGKLLGKWFLSDAPVTGFVKLHCGLTGGTEKINGGSATTSNYFIGPTIEELIGLKIGPVVSIEGGAFQIVLFGSKVLPSDIGFTAGIGFTL